MSSIPFRHWSQQQGSGMQMHSTGRSAAAAGHRLFFLLLLWTISLRAQSLPGIEGKVYDAVDGSPVAGAQVLILGTARGSLTDLNGHFGISSLLAGDYEVQITHLGHAPQVISAVAVGLDQPALLLVRLEPQLLELPGLVITAERDRGAALSSVEISRQQIERSQARDLGELLANSGGVQVNDNGSSRSLSVRGSAANQVAVFIDGIRLDNPQTGAVDLSLLPLTSVESVTVHKGARSLEYGSGAIGGVVEIHTRRPDHDDWSAEARAGAFGSTGGIFSWSRAWRRLQWHLALEHRRSQGDYAYTYERTGQLIEERRRNGDTEQNQLYVRLAGAGAGIVWTLSAQKLRSDRGLPGQIYAWTPGARAAADRDLWGATAIHTGLNAGWKAGMAYTRERSDYRHHPDARWPLRDRMVPAYWNESRLGSGQLTLEGWRQGWRGSRWIAGAEAGVDRFSDLDHLAPGGGTGSVRSHHAAALGRVEWQEELPFSATFALVAGMRLDQAQIEHTSQRRHDGVWSPALSLALTRPAWAGMRLHAAWSRGFRLPTFSDLFYQQYRVAGNAALRPERSDSREAGLSFTAPARSRISITGFRNRIEDLIIWRMGSFATFAPVNTDALLRGLEFESQWSLLPDRLEVQLSHLRLESENLQAGHTVYGKSLPYRPAHTTKYSLRWTPGPLFVEYAARALGPRYVTESNTVRLPGYTAHDFSAGIRFRVRNVEQQIKVAILNLSDRRFQLIENGPLPGREWRLAWQIGQP